MDLSLHIGHRCLGGERHFADQLGVVGLNDFDLGEGGGGEMWIGKYIIVKL